MAVLVAPGGSVSASEGPFLRDAAAYLSALVLIALSFVDATVQGSESAFLLVAYALYVAVVCLGGNHAVPTVVDPICTQCPFEGVELTGRHGARSLGCEQAARPTSPVSASGAERSAGHAVRRHAVQAVGQGEASPAEDGCDTVSGDLEAAERDDDAGSGVQQGGWLRCGVLIGPPADGPTGLGAQVKHPAKSPPFRVAAVDSPPLHCRRHNTGSSPTAGLRNHRLHAGLSRSPLPHAC